MSKETPVQKKENEVPPLSAYFVGKAIVNDRVKRFMGGKHQLLTTAMNNNNEESKYVWYPKEYLMTLFDEMERYNANGLRIYFGEYDSHAGEPAPGQLGLLLVLTQLKNDGKVHDLLFEEQGDFVERSGLARSRGEDFNQTPENGISHEFNAMLPCPPGGANHVLSFPEEELS